MTMKVDATGISAVVTCTLCPYWFGFGFDRDHGWRVARDHEQRAHPGQVQAALAIEKARQRRR